MRFITPFIVLLFTFLAAKSQKVNPRDPNEWEYELLSKNQGSIQDTSHTIGIVVFYSNFPIIETVPDDGKTVLKRKSIHYPQISFHVFNIQDLGFCQDIARKIKDTSTCKDNQDAGDYFIAGKFVFMNLEDCYPCIVEKNAKDMCKPFIESLFKKIDNKENFDLKNLLTKLPIKELNRK